MVEINPMIIHFTHSKICERFTGCGKLLQETVDEIKCGETLIDSIPKIKVFYIHTDCGIKYFSLNNRRLWVFKTLYSMGIIKNIVVRLEKTTDTKYLTNKYALKAKIIKRK